MGTLKQYFNKAVYTLSSIYGISRTEAKGFVLLIPILFVLITTPLWYRHVRMALAMHEEVPDQHETFLQWRASIVGALTEEAGTEIKNIREVRPAAFDPNTANETQLISVGFSEAMAARIVKYRNAGGKFSVKADLKKMYGMPEELVASLWEYIELPEEKPKWEEKPEKEDNRFESRYPPTTKIAPTITSYDINRAVAEDFATINGIGPAISTRIVKYREALGGFISIDQLKEVYGVEQYLVDSINAKFQLDTSVANKLSINTADAALLEKHPYISRKLATVIVAYRVQNGNFKSVDELKNIRILSDSIYQKLVPYIQID